MSNSYISPQLRQMHRWVGLFVLLILVAGAAILFTAGRAQNWFSPGVTVRVLMPQSGLSGLSSGARVEIFGTDAGTIRQVVIQADGQSYAIASVRRDFLPFLRDDSRALIRRQFGVAGAAYLEITRGHGPVLDPGYLVIDASADRAPTETLDSIINELRDEFLPILNEVKRAVTTYADLGDELLDPDGELRQMTLSLQRIVSRIESGDGAIGKLLSDEQLYAELLQFSRDLNTRLEGAEPIFEDLRTTTRNIATLTTSLEQEADTFPQLLRNVTETTADLPPLLWQLESTLGQLDALLLQLRGHWLLGGSSGDADLPTAAPIPPQRLPPWQISSPSQDLQRNE